MNHSPKPKDSEIRPSETKVAAPRFTPQRPMMVTSKTLGTNHIYKLSTQNLSKSGLLLSARSNLKIPYRENTILEMTIDPDSSNFTRPISCIGKVVRLANADGEGDECFLGVTIVQMEPDFQTAWEIEIDTMRVDSLP